MYDSTRGLASFYYVLLFKLDIRFRYAVFYKDLILYFKRES